MGEAATRERVATPWAPAGGRPPLLNRIAPELW